MCMRARSAINFHLRRCELVDSVAAGQMPRTIVFQDRFDVFVVINQRTGKRARGRTLGKNANPFVPGVIKAKLNENAEHAILLKPAAINQSGRHV